MVTFKCKQSGNTVSFSDQNDIECMRKEIGYDEVKDGLQEVKEAPKAPAQEVKKRGRPARRDEI